MAFNLINYLQSLQSSAAPAPTATMPASRTTAPPSASEISRVLVGETRKEVYTIQQTDVIECAFSHINVISGLLYVFKGVTNGVLGPAVGTAYIGTTMQHLTEVRNTGDENVPVLINETVKSDLQSARTYVRGTAGDQILLRYRDR